MLMVLFMKVSALSWSTSPLTFQRPFALYTPSLHYWLHLSSFKVSGPKDPEREREGEREGKRQREREREILSSLKGQNAQSKKGGHCRGLAWGQVIHSNAASRVQWVN